MKPILIVPTTDGESLKINKNYIKKLTMFNAKIVIAHYNKIFIKNVKDFSGILLTGGGDISSKYLNEALHPKAKDVFVDRDNFEVDLIKKAYQKKIPMLGICRGMQIINVALGGKINQHIEGHIQQTKRNLPHHNVKIKQNTKLFGVLKSEIVKVNSFHHQVVEKVPKNFVVCAKSFDGYIEAIETTKNFFCVGVQWHPEAMNNSLQNNIFKCFVESTSL